MQLVAPQTNKTKMKVYQPEQGPNDNITIFLNTFKGCDVPYTPVKGMDSVNDVDIRKVDAECRVIDRVAFYGNYSLESVKEQQKQHGHQYKMVVRCSQAGQYNLQVTYKNVKVGSHLVTVMAEEPVQAVVSLMGVSSGVASLNIRYIDSLGQKSSIQKRDILDNLEIRQSGMFPVDYQLFQERESSQCLVKFNCSQKAEYIVSQEGLEVAGSRLVFDE